MRKYLEAAVGKSPGPAKYGSSATDADLCAALADAAAHLRDSEALRRYAPRAEALATRHDHRLYLGIAHRAWGVAHRLTGQHDEAEARFRLALASFREMDARRQLGRTLSELAELHLARRDMAQTREAYRQALESFESLGAAPDAIRVREALDALGSQEVGKLGR